MFKNIIRVLGGDPNKKEIEKLAGIVEQVNALEPQFEALSEDELRGKTAEFRQRLADGETLDDLLVEAFAAVREAGKRTIGLRHYDVQLIGGMVLHQGKIAEMRTGEGKTLVATLPLYLNALAGKGVHLVTVNDYLARRDARWMAPIYQMLGMNVGVLQMASRTDNARNAFLVDLEKTSPHEDQHQLRMVLRKDAYQAEITYGTNNEFGFDYLRDNLTMTLEARSQRGHAYAIIDEVDNILIDEARTPLIISGPSSEDTEWYARMAQVVRALRPEDYEINEKDRNVTLTEVGEAHVEEILDTPLRDPERPEDITPEQARILGYLEKGLQAQFLYKRNKDYLVQSGKVVIVDEFTGRLMPGRRWSEGLHQAVEAKENVRVQAENITYATITLQNYFRLYEKLSGMTGTALTEAEEFAKIYKLEVLPIPTNLEFQASSSGSDLVEVKSKDEDGYPVTYYARQDDPQKAPLFWKRKDYPDLVFRTEEGKLRALSEEILRLHVMGRPMLVGTTSVEHSDRLAHRLEAEPLRRLLQVLLLRRTWMEKNKVDFIQSAVPELEPLNKPVTELNPGDMRPLAKSLDLSLNPEEPANIGHLLRFLRLEPQYAERLLQVVRGGVPHQVLNARVHDQEALMISRAGEYGAVTIATNMAGRGVDIKLGGQLTDELIRDTNRVLRRAGSDPFNLTEEERQAALDSLGPDEYYIYEDSVKAFKYHVDTMEQVRALGGLHVIGSERHEARRIDNQLRGRSARQGDPGSSRFYLSLEDDLMRLFGGGQVENIWKRVFSDESQPLEMNMLGKLVEQSQERVEGANFDVRKHLLEYDDVLNSQRKRIYGQRDRVFTKADLSEDVLDMLRTELQQRIPQSLADAEGPWRLIAYLEEVQSSFIFGNIGYPSFGFRLLFDDLKNRLAGQTLDGSVLLNELTDLAARALQAEKEHMLVSMRSALEKAEDSLDRQRVERLDSLDAYLDTVNEVNEEGLQRRPQEMLAELSELVRLPLRLSPEQLRGLPEGDRDVKASLRQQVVANLQALAVNRIVLLVRRRLEEAPPFRPADLENLSWDEVSGLVLDSAETLFDQRIERLAGADGEVRRDLENLFSKQQAIQLNDHNLIQLFTLLAQGSKMGFDARTHKRASKRVIRLNYIHAAARLLDEAEPAKVTEDVLKHLETGLEQMTLARGLSEYGRLAQMETTLAQLDEPTINLLEETLGASKLAELQSTPLTAIPGEERAQVIKVLGHRLQNEAYRFILLRVISEQWIDYLTEVEALRVSIGLEAYAQRDPLVQYKSKASDMFSGLLGQIRMGVISRVFNVQMRGGLATSTATPGSTLPSGGESIGELEPQEDAITVETPVQVTAQTAGQPGAGKKKRKRH